MKSVKKFPPKANTVAKWEAAHPEFFVAEQHPAVCHCGLCFQRALDALVSKTEEAANATDNQNNSPGYDGYNQLSRDTGADKTSVSL